MIATVGGGTTATPSYGDIFGGLAPGSGPIATAPAATWEESIANPALEAERVAGGMPAGNVPLWQQGTAVNVVVNNPAPEPASISVKTQLQRLATFGVI
jgi:hypothetical protein